MVDSNLFLPLTKKELDIRGWDSVDVILISGDAYVDHPSFGISIMGRIIENEGFRVAILAQPNWRDDFRDFKKLGKPKLFFGISSGSMDSMVNHYTAAKRLRSTDAYTPGNVAGFRPDYATTVYAQIIRNIYPDSLIILGGIEASMRRFVHYDYWKNKLLPPILYDSKADLLVYGMAEKTIRSILNIFKEKENPVPENFHHLNQIAYLTDNKENIQDKCLSLHSYKSCLESRKKFSDNFITIENESNRINAHILLQQVNEKYLIVNPPESIMSQEELDAVYKLPFTRLPHPKYSKRGDIPAFEMIKNSVNIHRGCFGGCSFCTISAHQGKFIVSRSEKSILDEINIISKMPYFKGHITDLGGPSANMYRMKGKREDACLQCRKPSCIFPKICMNLNFDHKPLITLYKKASALRGVKKISIGSGIRYDLLISEDKQKSKDYELNTYTDVLIRDYVSGRLKVAPEHTEEHVVKCMRKPSFSVFLEFKRKFDAINTKYHLNQQLIPYFISSHPACTSKDMQFLSTKIKRLQYYPEQVQDFTPTPMTLSSTIFYTGIDPVTGQKVYCAIDMDEKKRQKNFFFYYKKS
ncbi:MAG: YgiQ family radical SAM protein [Bacteroidales bacterium]|jgi:uncharacterized radical SAM protein YgiQ|nr:YgiQ family radical SAM protein [Bacteroidales bacterium]